MDKWFVKFLNLFSLNSFTFYYELMKLDNESFVMNVWEWTLDIMNHWYDFWYYDLWYDFWYFEPLIWLLIFWTIDMNPMIWTSDLNSDFEPLPYLNLWFEPLLCTLYWWPSVSDYDYGPWFWFCDDDLILWPSVLTYPVRYPSHFTRHGGSMSVSVMHLWHDSRAVEWCSATSPFYYMMCTLYDMIYYGQSDFCGGVWMHPRSVSVSDMIWYDMICLVNVAVCAIHVLHISGS